METIILLLPSMLDGLKTTLTLSVITLAVSLPLSVIVALLKMSRAKTLKYITSAYIYVMRGTPLLLQLMFVFFGLPYMNIVLQRETAAGLAFILNYTAYFAEIVRGGLQGIDKGQYEAAKILGMSKKNTFFKIVLPQVIKAILPAMGNETITLIKDTSLVYILGLGDLLRAGKIAANTFSSMIPFMMVGLIYLTVIAVLSRAFDLMEKHFGYYE
ncbi:amino acid ABC transporter permease [Proteocatella sphenisci]|uniref:amino acid ABC transporter permease n=1 Tax=Proteocatella sphenisci TaxID=181070 RepID=UPI0004912E15|nr:amino acid ABC transporter permease [Proteocatella sphenisci]